MIQTEIIKNKMMRGKILRTIALFYPSPMDIKDLKTSLMSRGVQLTADINKLLHYLQDKGYIKMSVPEICEVSDDTLVELTAKGIDLLEDSIKDPGVDI